MVFEKFFYCCFDVLVFENGECYFDVEFVLC